MLVRPPIYGLGILVDTGERADHWGDGDIPVLDPRRSTVLAAGLSTIDGDEYYDGDERRILAALDQRLAVLDPGIVCTWNGSVFDLPFLRVRARALGVELGLRLQRDRRRLPLTGRTRLRPGVAVGSPGSGVSHAVRGAWHRQRHLDLRRVYGPESDEVGEILALDPDRSAHLARSLAERRWSRARRHLDRVPPPDRMTSFTWTCLSPESIDGPAVTIPPEAKARHPSASRFAPRPARTSRHHRSRPSPLSLAEPPSAAAAAPAAERVSASAGGD